ncbi:MAG: hypothetical protein LBB43_01575 [Spirochaetaceae bacterium]|jgi:nitrogen regulatory protein PII|nr:hypothetical protein [Spirochaetaceae bacterium]
MAAPRLLFFIIDWGKSKAVTQVFEQEHIRFHFVSKGRGTASSEILDLLGIGVSDKAVVLCIERAAVMSVLVKNVRKKLGRQSVGAGIAFTVPLSSVNKPVLEIFTKHTNFKLFPIKGTDKMEEETKQPITNDLIISIINQGYSDEFMATAREAGARGGTIINARGFAHQGLKFFGVSVQDEREIILMVTKREQKTAIMQALSQKYGMASKAGGLIFSCPVDSIMSLNADAE